MNARHTAVLAIVLCAFACSHKSPVGWYLMTPPQATDANGVPLVGPDIRAPLSHWQKTRLGKPGKQFEAFDSERACEEYRRNEITDARTKVEGAPEGIESKPAETAYVRWIYFLGALHDECVAADDPRLSK
jgi:hypothetical protein